MTQSEHEDLFADWTVQLEQMTHQDWAQLKAECEQSRLNSAITDGIMLQKEKPRYGKNFSRG